MSAIQWSYPTMYKWYLKHQDNPSDKVVSIIYHSQRCSKNEKHLEPFIKPNIVYVGEAPVQNQEMFPLGLYTVIDDNKKGMMNLFFVYPQLKDCVGKLVTFADHYTMALNTANVKNATQFHHTYYGCLQPDAKTVQYVSKHPKYNFPRELEMPRDGDIPSILKDIGQNKPVLLDLLRWPWNHDRTPRSSGGATKKCGKIPARAITSQPFCDLWSKAEFNSMYAFGYRHPDGHITWSVRFHRKGRQERTETAYMFDTPIYDETVFQNTLANLARLEILLG